MKARFKACLMCQSKVTVQIRLNRIYNRSKFRPNFSYDLRLKRNSKPNFGFTPKLFGTIHILTEVTWTQPKTLVFGFKQNRSYCFVLTTDAISEAPAKKIINADRMRSNFLAFYALVHRLVGLFTDKRNDKKCKLRLQFCDHSWSVYTKHRL